MREADLAAGLSIVVHDTVHTTPGTDAAGAKMLCADLAHAPSMSGHLLPLTT